MRQRLSIAIALAEKLHHSAQKVVEQHVVPPEPKTASAREGEEYKRNALHRALRGQKSPLLGTRTVSTALVLQVVLPDLGGEVVHDATLVAFLVRWTPFGEGGGEDEGGGEEKVELEKKREEVEELRMLRQMPLVQLTPLQQRRLGLPAFQRTPPDPGADRGHGDTVG